MSKFDFMNFGDGYNDMEFVVHAKKFTKEEAINLCLAENGWRFEKGRCNPTPLRKPTINDIGCAFVRWFVRAPESCDYDDEGRGCYTYTSPDDRGAFPVWIIQFKALEVPKNENQNQS